MLTSPSSIKARSRIPSKPSDLTPERSRRDALAIVLHFQDEPSVAAGQSYVHPRRPGVPGDVGESFLKNAEGGGCAVLAQRDVLQLGNELAFDARPLLKILDLPFDGRLQAQIIEDTRS